MKILALLLTLAHAASASAVAFDWVNVIETVQPFDTQGYKTYAVPAADSQLDFPVMLATNNTALSLITMIDDTRPGSFVNFGRITWDLGPGVTYGASNLIVGDVYTLVVSDQDAVPIQFQLNVALFGFDPTDPVPDRFQKTPEASSAGLVLAGIGIVVSLRRCRKHRTLIVGSRICSVCDKEAAAEKPVDLPAIRDEHYNDVAGNVIEAPQA